MPSQKAQITTKNLEVLSELLMLEELAYKKCDTYATVFTDSELQKHCKALAKSHKARYMAMYDYLNTHE